MPRLEKLLNEVEEKVLEKMQERDMEEGEIKEVAAKVALAAIKYGDLSNQASKDYIFDMERFTSFEGNTGPYIFYTIVRIKSLLAKVKEKGIVIDEDAPLEPAHSQSETDVMLSLCNSLCSI